MVIVVSNCSSPPVLIPHESVGFPGNTVYNGNGHGVLRVTWGDILRAAITVGRPGWYYVFQHGQPSAYEALFRWSLVKMALEPNHLYGPILRRTSVARNLDPTEKGMVNYSLGMMFCKLFAEKLLDTPWLLHLDVFRPQLDVQLRGRSRPDLIGQDNSMGQWHGFECKGRVNRPGANTIAAAKGQAQRLQSVNRGPCSLHIAAITYFRNEELNFYWCDPPAAEGELSPIDLTLPEDVWRHYYGVVAEVITQSEEEEQRAAIGVRRGQDESGHTYAVVEQCDVEIVVHRAIAEHVVARQWGEARLSAFRASEQLAADEFPADGIQVNAGESWFQTR